MIATLAAGAATYLVLGGQLGTFPRVAFALYTGVISILVRRSSAPRLVAFVTLVTSAVTYWMAGYVLPDWLQWGATMLAAFCVARMGESEIIIVYIYH